MPPKQIDSAPPLTLEDSTRLSPHATPPNAQDFPRWPLPTDAKIEGVVGEHVDRLRALHQHTPVIANQLYNSIVEIYNDWSLSDAAKRDRTGKLAVAKVRETVALFGEPADKLKAARSKLEGAAREKMNAVGSRDDRGQEIRAWLRSLSPKDRLEVFFLAREGKIDGADELVLAVLGHPLSPRLSGFTSAECQLTVQAARDQYLMTHAGSELNRVFEINSALEAAQNALRWLETQARGMVPGRWVEAATAEWRSLTLAEKVARTSEALAAGRVQDAHNAATGVITP